MYSVCVCVAGSDCVDLSIWPIWLCIIGVNTLLAICISTLSEENTISSKQQTCIFILQEFRLFVCNVLYLYIYSY